MPTFCDNPTGSDVAQYLGRLDLAFANGPAASAVSMARQMAKSYCRERGFDIDTQIPESLWWVIISRAARLVLNNNQLISQTTDGSTQLYGSAGQGWTLAELTALNDFRRTAA